VRGAHAGFQLGLEMLSVLPLIAKKVGGQEAPGMPLFISKGAHFNKGDALYVVEVMKMFNKVLAPFAGTVDEILVEGNGTIVQKGQILFKVTPDEKVVVEDPKEREKRIRATTDGYVAGVC
jgi:pyruvate/2-oxoglutarate dehydrogenase complex dihydrolipoamide acyltransferase (E2) component